MAEKDIRKTALVLFFRLQLETQNLLNRLEEFPQYPEMHLSESISFSFQPF